MTTPRTHQMGTRHSWVHTKLILRVRTLLLWISNETIADNVSWSLKAIFADFFLIIIDTMTWIFIIIMLAGPMSIEGLFEALLDFRIMRFVQSTDYRHDYYTRCERMQLLLTVACENLALDVAEPQEEILEALERTSMPQPAGNVALQEIAAQARLLSMMGSQSIFDAAEGASVLFYIGAFGIAPVVRMQPSHLHSGSNG